jgi:aryl-alcohol dehydrogenase-like predicted oxidoreductase
MHSLPTTLFTPGGPEITRIGLGGEGILRTFGREPEARDVVQEALAQGITYFDTAPAYSGSQAYLGSVWGDQPGARSKVFQTSKSAERSYTGAMSDLERSLETLQTEFLDLWQIHDVRSEKDLHRLEAGDGALQAFIAARDQGLVKRVGVTGHHDPGILLHCVRTWPLDSVLLPVNPAEAALHGFLDQIVPEARQRSMAVIGMKCLGGGHYVQPDRGVTAERLIRYALQAGPDLIVIGCSSPLEVQELISAATNAPLPDEERSALEQAFKPNADRLAFYRGGG